MAAKTVFKRGARENADAVKALFAENIDLAERSVCGVELVILFAKRIRKAVDFFEPYADFKLFLFLAEFEEFLSLFALCFKRADTVFKLSENIEKTD